MKIPRLFPERRVAISATKLYLELTISGLTALAAIAAVKLILSVKLSPILLVTDVLIALVCGVISFIMLRRAFRG
jgi:hypothetical protein